MIRMKTVVMSCLLLGMALPAIASSRTVVREGNDLFEQGDFTASLEKYREALQKEPESAIINFNLGTALFKDGDYQGAIDPLQKALLSEDGSLRAQAYYNLGNVQYKSGRQVEDQNIELAIAALKQALRSYDEALEIEAEDEDARFNRDFVKEQLELLKKRQQQQQNQQQDQEQQQQGDQQQQNQPEQGQQSQSDQEEKQQQDQSRQDQAQDQGQQDEQQGQGEQDQPASTEDEQSSPGGTPGQDQSDDQGASAGQEQQRLTRQEANMLLKDYQQNEEPQGLLNFIPQRAPQDPVMKDW